jgi:hypothetical protein
MTYNDAIELRDKHKDLIGKPMLGKPNGWDIKDVIVTDIGNIVNVYERMWQNNMNNETALKFVTTQPDNYNVVVISHQWPWGSGNLFYEVLESYLKHNP